MNITSHLVCRWDCRRLGVQAGIFILVCCLILPRAIAQDSSAQENWQEKYDLQINRTIRKFSTTETVPAQWTDDNVEIHPEYTVEKTNSLEEQIYIFTPKRAPQFKQRIAENVAVYTAQDIAKFPARDLSEALVYIPEVDVQFNGFFGQSTALSIQGSQSRQVLLMVDGIPFNTQLSGQANPAEIPIEQIQQIEIVQGGSSSVWGSSLGGVINVITKDVGKTSVPKGSVTSTFGEFKTFKQAFDVSGGNKKAGYFFSGSLMQTDGILSESDTKGKKGFGKVAVPLGDDLRLTGSFGYSGADVRYGVTRSNTINSQPYITRYGLLQLQRDHDGGSFQTAYKYNDQKITTDIYNATTGAQTSSTISRDVYQGLSLNENFHWGNDYSSVIGADFESHRIRSNRYLASAKTVNTQAPYANTTIVVGPWDIIPGVRYDHNQKFGSQTSPSLGTIYHFEDEHESLIRTRIARVFTAPPLFWSVNNDPSQFVGPNPALKPERAIAYEIGMETHPTTAWDTSLNYYLSDVKDAIALVFDPNQFVFIQDNFRKFRRQGVELKTRYRLDPHWSLFSSGAFNDVENLATKKTFRDQGIARQRYTFGVGFQHPNGWAFDVLGYYNRWSSQPSLQSNDRKPIFDAKITKTFPHITKSMDVKAFLDVHNLTNSKYWSDITFPLARRYFEGGLTVNF